MEPSQTPPATNPAAPLSSPAPATSSTNTAEKATAAASSAPAVPAGAPLSTFDHFTKIDLRVATVLEARPHTKGDKLLVLQLDLGNGEKRQICAGIRQHVTPESMVGRQIIIVANLEPRKLMGEVSQGMLLAATDASGKVVVLGPSEPVSAGAHVR